MERAKRLLAEAAPDNLRYAALELRMCMEALTYEKLRSFSSAVPESVLSTWQPPQAVKALLEFEPMADKSFTIYAGLEDEPGKPAKKMQFVGHHKALGLKWLRKHYNKIGTMLHVPMGGAQSEPLLENQLQYLKEVVEDLDEALSSNILGGSLREVFTFECVYCKQPIVSNKQAVEMRRKAVCLNPQCGAEYYAEPKDGQMAFQPMATRFDCVHCNAEIPIENRKIDIGFSFKCEKCGTKHRVVGRQWSYGNEES